MIDKKWIEKLVEEKLDENMFLVDVSVSKANAINIFADSFAGLTIEQCQEISRHVEQRLNREVEDFELQVSSPGLTEGFKVKEQYLKNVGREVEVLTNEEIKITGVLVEIDEEKIILRTSSRKKIEGHKKKQLVEKEHIVRYDEIKTAKVVISFK